MIGTVYVIECSVTCKVYVGATRQWPYKKRLWDHFKLAKSGKKKCCRKLSEAIREHGKENFTIRPLFFAFDQELLEYMEIAAIKDFNSIEDGYNIQTGGSRGKPTKETGELIRKSHKEKGHKYPKRTPEQQKEFNQKLSDARRGNSPKAAIAVRKVPVWVRGFLYPDMQTAEEMEGFTPGYISNQVKHAKYPKYGIEPLIPVERKPRNQLRGKAREKFLAEQAAKKPSPK